MSSFSYHNLLFLLRSTKGEQFLDLLLDVNSKQVREDFAMLNIMATISCLKDNAMSAEQRNDFCLITKACYIFHYKREKVIIPEWLLYKYFYKN